MPGPYFLQHAVQVGRVIVLETGQFALGQPAAVQDACMVQLVYHREIAFADQSGDDAEVHLVAGSVDQGGFPALEGRYLPFQLHVQDGISVEEAGAGHAGAETLHRVDGSLLHAGVIGQPEVVVGAEHYEFLALDAYFGGLFGFEFFEIGIDAGFY